MSNWEKAKFVAGNAVLGGKNGWILGQLEHGAFSVTPHGTAVWRVAKDLKMDDNKTVEALAEKITLGLDLVSSQKVAQWETELLQAVEKAPVEQQNGWDKVRKFAGIRAKGKSASEYELKKYELNKAALEGNRPQENLRYYMKENADLVNSLRYSPMAPITLATQIIEQDKYKSTLNQLARKGSMGIIRDHSADAVRFINAKAASEAKWEGAVMAEHLNYRFSGVRGYNTVFLDISKRNFEASESALSITGLEDSFITETAAYFNNLFITADSLAKLVGRYRSLN